MTNQKITFTTKSKPRPQGKFVSMALDPVSVEIEETNFPTTGGDKQVKRIRFFPNIAINQTDIKNALQIVNGEVKKLTFEIEIDGTKVEAKEPKQHSASASAGKWNTASAGPAGEPEENDWDNGLLSLRKFKLADITVKNSSGETGEQQQNSDSQNKKRTGNKPQSTNKTSNTNQSSSGNSDNNSEEKPGDNTADDNSSSNQSTNESPPPRQPDPDQPTQEEINNSRENLNQAKQSGDKDQLSESIKKDEWLKDKGVKSSENEAANQSAREELAKNKEDYRKTIFEATQKKLTNNGVNKDELGTEVKTKFQKLENGEITEKSAVDEAEQEIVKDVYEKAATKKITDLENQVKEVLESKDKKKMEVLQRKLSQFINNSNYQTKKTAAETLMKKLETALKQNTSTDNKNDIPWGVIVPIALIAVAALVGIIIYARKKKANNS